MVSQLNLFNQPTLNVLRTVKEGLAHAYKVSGLSLDNVCDQANRLAERYGVCLVKGRGTRLNKDTLEKWLNPEDKIRNPSIKALPVICSVLNTIEPIQAMIEPLGWQVIGEYDTKVLTWAKHYYNARDSRAAMKKIEAEL